MRCHSHPDIEAIGFCSICGLPLCRECIAEEDNVIYCKECYQHEEYIDMELMDLLDTEDDEGLF